MQPSAPIFAGSSPEVCNANLANLRSPALASNTSKTRQKSVDLASHLASVLTKLTVEGRRAGARTVSQSKFRNHRQFSAPSEIHPNDMKSIAADELRLTERRQPFAKPADVGGASVIVPPMHIGNNERPAGVLD